MKMRFTRNSENYSIQSCFEKFIRSCEAKNLSRATIQFYENSHKRFSQFIDTSLAVSAITPDTINEYILFIRNNTKANDVSTQTYIRAIRAFCYYLMDMGYLGEFKIRLPKAVEKLKTTYTRAELAKLIKKPNLMKCSWVEFRTWAYTNYLLSTGNRLRSAQNVKIGDIDIDTGYIILKTTKNKTEQVIPISESLRKVLVEYIAIRGGHAEDYLFCSEQGEQLSAEGLKSSFDRYCKDRNVPQRGSHALRHSFAKMYLMNGGDIFRLQKLLGHKDISVTRKYLDLLPEDLKQDYDKLNPLDSMKMNKDRITMKRGKRR